MAGGACLVVTALTFALLCHLTVAQIVYVNPDCFHVERPLGGMEPPALPLGYDQLCMDIDSALDGLESGMTLRLEEGIHVITRPHFNDTRGMTNVSINGSGVRETVITCENKLGLSLIGVESLSFSDFTIANCGLTGVNLDFSLTLLKESLDLWILVPLSTRVALLVGDCKDVLMQNVHITNTTGLGLLGINVIGRSSLSGVSFTRNIRPRCVNLEPILPSDISSDIYDQVGGGAYFLYTDYRNSSEAVGNVLLSLTDCYFAHNADCTYASLISVNFPIFTDGMNFANGSRGLYEYAVGAGGGLSIVLANSEFGVEAVVFNTTFYRNDARYGGGAYVATFAGFLFPVSVVFTGCTFMENGLASSDGVLQDTHCRGGAGLSIFTDQVKPQHFLGPIPSPEVLLVSVSAVETDFIGNQAEIHGGGVLAYSFFTTPQANFDLFAPNHYFINWRLSDTTFTHNIARYGSAAFFTQLSSSGVSGSVFTVLRSIRVLKNVNRLDRVSALSVYEEASTLYTSQVPCSFIGGGNIFSENQGSALNVVSTVVAIFFDASVTFQQNVAHRGGALYLTGNHPAIVVHPGCSLNFINNQAVLEGGAIYVDSVLNPLGNIQPTNSLNCFLTTPFISSSDFRPHFGLFDNNISISFANNSAPLGGIVFGSSLESCPWARNISHSDDLSLFQVLEGSSTFSFSDEPTGRDRISTLPASLKVTLLGSTTEPIEVFPGQAIEIGIQVFDAYNNPIPSIVTSAVDRSLYSADSILGDSGFWYTSINKTTLTITGNNEGPLDVTIITEINSLSFTLSMYLRPCPLGFSIDSSQRCACDELLMDARGILCLEDSVSFSTSEGVWIGTDPSIANPNSSDLIVDACILDYCVGNRTVTVGNNAGNDTVNYSPFDAQCGLNRAGLLCGGCAEGYSIVFGTNECVRCNNYWLILIPVFALAGAVVFAAVALLEITIDKGWTNAVLFLVFVFSFLGFLSPNLTYRYYALPFRLIGLQLGASTCFFDGMTTLHRSCILFVFPTYLFILMAIFAILCRRFSWMSVHFSPAKTLVTLILMCYFSVLTTTLEIIMPKRVRTVGGDVSYQWGIDPNQVYFAGGHIFLVLYAIVVLFIYIIPFPLLLLFPPIAYRCLRRFSPFLDVLWAAYKPKLRFWLGVRVIVVIAFYFTTRLSVFNSGMYGGVILVVFTYTQAFLQPLKDKWANYADAVFSVIILMLLWGGQTISVADYEGEAGVTTDVSFAVLVTIMYGLYLLLFGLHLHRQFPSLGPRLHKRITDPKRRASQRDTTDRIEELSERLNEPDNSNRESPIASSSSLRISRPPSPTRFPQMQGTPRYRDSILSVS